jgi:hypothetical protein
MAKVFPLSYVVSFYYPVPGSNKKVRYTTEDRDVISHDPTIVVSQDPIDG